MIVEKEILPQASVAQTARRLAVLALLAWAPTGAQGADPVTARLGLWSDVQEWPVVAVHAVLMHDGKVLAWDATPDDFDDDPHTAEVKTTRVTVWDPRTGTHTRVDNNTNTDLFCAGAAHLWDGDLLLAGGDDAPGGAPGTAAGASSNSNIFHPDAQQWTRLENMASARWYSTVAALPSGEMLTFGGNYRIEPFAEVLGLDRSWRPLPIGYREPAEDEAPDPNRLPYHFSGDYQWLQVTPSGQVASFGPQQSLGYVDTAGLGKWQGLPNVRDQVPYRGYGSFAPYQVGKVLITGGVGYYSTGPVPESSAVVLDLNTMQSEATADMIYQRSQHNLTVLPDGKVLATGGHSGTDLLINLSESVLPAEIWDPETGTWTEVAGMARTRQYHSVAVLLPDARVLVAGGGYCGDCTTLGYHEQNAEIYSPPYLFDEQGNLAEQPQLSSVPVRLNYASTFQIQVQSTAPVRRLVMIKPSATTHSHNQDQRYIDLEFDVDGTQITAQSPDNRNLAPPGHYMLFALDQNGVPSEAKFIQVGQPTVAPGQAVAQQVAEAEVDIYAVESYAGDASLRISLEGIVGDADLYIRKDRYPEARADGEYDCGSARFDASDEVCQIDNPGRHTWYVGVSGWRRSDYQLVVSGEGDDTVLSGEVDPGKRAGTVNPSTGVASSSDSGGSGGAIGLPWLLCGLGFAVAVGRGRRRPV